MHTLHKTPGPVSLAYESQGSGPLVVFLHGIGGNRTNWYGQLDHFSDKFCAVTWDARGYGASDDPPHALKFSDYADDLAHLLDHLKAERAHLVGLSMGGMILQDFYNRYVKRVATLSLIDTSAGFGAASEEAKRDFLARRLEPLERGQTPKDIAPGVVQVLASKHASPAVREQLMASLSALRVGPYKQALHAIVATDFRAMLSTIAVPTLVIVGDEDVVTPPAASEFLAKSITGASLVRIPQAGHLTNIEKPQEFNAALRSFLEKYAQRASVVSAS
ncbi:MAG TPA: alpha/beta fold hydrolase [Methylomirabilota bacterium]|jgi:pimeloyl-ACP methyl ester carboxylesterase|nr:alpha/beta fold hydrolase [Methylomirabilota bacterium]